MRHGRIESKPTCPHCKKALDGFTHLFGEASPSDGDVSVCLYCAEIVEFTVDDNGLKLVPLTEETTGELDLAEIQEAQRMTRAYIEKQKTS